MIERGELSRGRSAEPEVAFAAGQVPMMEERLSRDIDRWRDKVELSLDGRQIFFLFFGSALALCLVFVLGVMVGQRLEARTRAEAAAAKADPLALLDQLDEAADDGADKGVVPSRKEELSGPGAGKGAAKPAAKEPAKVEARADVKAPEAKAADVKPGPRPEVPKVEAPKAEPAKEAPKVEAKPQKPEPAPMPAVVPPKVEVARPEPPRPAKAEVPKAPAKVEPKEPAAPKAEPKDVAAAKDPADGRDSASKGKYTLQLSSFPEKAEAEAFAKKFDGSGMKVSIVSVSLPGKGTWWRVRAGVFSTEKAALEAKVSVEKKHSVIAYVARMTQ